MKKDKWIKVRCTEEQRDFAYKKAEEAGMTYSSYLWFLLYTAEDLKKWDKFHDAIEMPMAALSEAYKKYIESIGE